MTDRETMQILLSDMRERLARGGLTYLEAVRIDDVVALAESLIFDSTWPANAETRSAVRLADGAELAEDGRP